jgi:hypothetical protein
VRLVDDGAARSSRSQKPTVERWQPRVVMRKVG